jgi:hypothetical protein
MAKKAILGLDGEDGIAGLKMELVHHCFRQGGADRAAGTAQPAHVVISGTHRHTSWHKLCLPSSNGPASGILDL